MLHGVSFPSFYNGRDTVQGWIYVPAAEPKGIVQLVHGFGEHSRRYLYRIVRFLEGGCIVFADEERPPWRTTPGATGEMRAATRCGRMSTP